MDSQLGAFTAKQWLILSALVALLIVGSAGLWSFAAEFIAARRAGYGFMSALNGVSRKSAPILVPAIIAGDGFSGDDRSEPGPTEPHDRQFDTPDYGGGWSDDGGFDGGGYAGGDC